MAGLDAMWKTDSPARELVDARPQALPRLVQHGRLLESEKECKDSTEWICTHTDCASVGTVDCAFFATHKASGNDCGAFKDYGQEWVTRDRTGELVYSLACSDGPHCASVSCSMACKVTCDTCPSAGQKIPICVDGVSAHEIGTPVRTRQSLASHHSPLCVRPSPMPGCSFATDDSYAYWLAGITGSPYLEEHSADGQCHDGRGPGSQQSCQNVPSGSYWAMGLDCTDCGPYWVTPDCACTTDGKSGTATGLPVGCTDHLVTQIPGYDYCYVVEPRKCRASTALVQMSTSFAGAGYRRCSDWTEPPAPPSPDGGGDSGGDGAGGAGGEGDSSGSSLHIEAGGSVTIHPGGKIELGV